MSRMKNPSAPMVASKSPEELLALKEAMLKRAISEGTLAEVLGEEGLTIAALYEQNEKVLYSLICFAVQENRFAEIAELLKNANVDVNILYKHSVLVETAKQNEYPEQSEDEGLFSEDPSNEVDSKWDVEHEDGQEDSHITYDSVLVETAKQNEYFEQPEDEGRFSEDSSDEVDSELVEGHEGNEESEEDHHITYANRLFKAAIETGNLPEVISAFSIDIDKSSMYQTLALIHRFIHKGDDGEVEDLKKDIDSFLEKASPERLGLIASFVGYDTGNIPNIDEPRGAIDLFLENTSPKRLSSIASFIDHVSHISFGRNDRLDAASINKLRIDQLREAISSFLENASPEKLNLITRFISYDIDELRGAIGLFLENALPEELDSVEKFVDGASERVLNVVDINQLRENIASLLEKATPRELESIVSRIRDESEDGSRAVEFTLDVGELRNAINLSFENATPEKLKSTIKSIFADILESKIVLFLEHEEPEDLRSIVEFVGREKYSDLKFTQWFFTYSNFCLLKVAIAAGNLQQVSESIQVNPHELPERQAHMLAIDAIKTNQLGDAAQFFRGRDLNLLYDECEVSMLAIAAKSGNFAATIGAFGIDLQRFAEYRICSMIREWLEDINDTERGDFHVRSSMKSLLAIELDHEDNYADLPGQTVATQEEVRAILKRLGSNFELSYNLHLYSLLHILATEGTLDQIRGLPGVEFHGVFRDVDLAQLEAIGLDGFIEIAEFFDINIEELDQIRLLHLLLENNDTARALSFLGMELPENETIEMLKLKTAIAAGRLQDMLSYVSRSYGQSDGYISRILSKQDLYSLAYFAVQENQLDGIKHLFNELRDNHCFHRESWDLFDRKDKANLAQLFEVAIAAGNLAETMEAFKINITVLYAYKIRPVLEEWVNDVCASDSEFLEALIYKVDYYMHELSESLSARLLRGEDLTPDDAQKIAQSFDLSSYSGGGIRALEISAERGYLQEVLRFLNIDISTISENIQSLLLQAAGVNQLVNVAECLGVDLSALDMDTQTPLGFSLIPMEHSERPDALSDVDITVAGDLAIL